MSHTVIIGNGISGITAARHLRKLDESHQITVISGESEYFFSRTALMYVYMGDMQFEHTQPYENWFWTKNRIDLVHQWVTKIDVEHKSVMLDNNETLKFDSLILATGSKPNKFGWPGQDLPAVRGLYSKQDLESIEKHTKNISSAVIVGGGLIGIELAEMLRTRDIEVTFLVREANFWDIVLPTEEAKMIDQEINDHHIDLRLDTELKEIVANKEDQVMGVTTNSGEEIACQFVGLTVGVSPNIAWLGEMGIETNRGILVNEFLETNVKDVYAIGDCAEFRTPNQGRRPIEQVWYTGRMMGEVVASTVVGNKRAYVPGIWFNSAKFLNIEYQTYGTVVATLPEGQESFFWKSESNKKCLRIVFDEKTTEVIGVNVFGMRMRHEVWDKWIGNKEKISFVMDHLEEANFDPEFFKRHEYEIRTSFNENFDYMEVQNSEPTILSRILS
jgi:NAD(P)H-nitrite reductase large subunit